MSFQWWCVSENLIDHHLHANENEAPTELIPSSGLPLQVYVYEGGDIVSNEIRDTGTWEQSELDDVMSTLEKGGQQEVGSAGASAAEVPSPRKGLLLDIGANIGWYTLNAAAAGHDVIAFEPFRPNVALIQRGLCDALNRQRLENKLEKNVKLYPVALDRKVGFLFGFFRKEGAALKLMMGCSTNGRRTSQYANGNVNCSQDLRNNHT